MHPVTIKLPHDALAFLLDAVAAHSDTLAARASDPRLAPLDAVRLLRQSIALSSISDSIRAGVAQAVSS